PTVAEMMLNHRLPLCAFLFVLTGCALTVRGQSQVAATYAGKSVDEWTEILAANLGGDSDNDKERCRKAADALGRIGPAARGAVEPLSEALRSPKVEVREFAVYALGRIGPSAAAAVPAIVAEMDLPPDHVNYALLATFRRLAAESLGRIGPAAAEAVPALGRALRNEDPAYRAQAALALWRILKQPRAIDFLASMIEPTSTEGSYDAVVALGDVGPEASSAIDRLVDALDYPQADVRRAAADVLVRLGPETIAPIAGRIQQGTLRWPAPAAYALGELVAPLRRNVFYQPTVDRSAFDSAAGPVTQFAAPALIGLLSDSRDDVRESAELALSQLGILALPYLLDLLDGDDVVRQAAMETLIRTESKLPPRGEASEPLAALNRSLMTRLMELMQHRDSQVRGAAVRVFASLSFDGEGLPALPLLRQALKDENLAVRRYAAQAIRQLGSED
ncbi:MAG: HEAT repeat domain-containing protein, partial [Planctomycetes bacterium]|nr:HEAT repeat domain-containing protein [Planctomycetota bacterium]